jgi:DNA repair protein RadA/Sms
MARSKSRWICQECGFQTSRFLGRCTECNSWNSLAEEIVADEPASLRGKGAFKAAATTGASSPKLLAEVPIFKDERIATGFAGVDEVLGGGLVPGSVVLLAGDPGVGKSTLLLQLTEMMSARGTVMYVTGEESAQQVKLRAERLGITRGNILVYAEQNVSSIESRLSEENISVLIVDSIQSVFHPELSSAPGSVSQVRESAAVLASSAKAANVATILVGHVTKDGTIAGPRVLEHMVDVVLQFEGERARQLRILRSCKNRYGSTQEVGVFSMGENGLTEIDNPSVLFLGDRLGKLSHEKAASGTAVIAAVEGTKTLMLEVQALVGPTPFPGPRRVSNGWDNNRLLQLLAVLEKRIGLTLSRFDVYVNIVGGFNFTDPAGDLGVALAIATSCLDRSVDPRLICIGEVGLTGEVRPVAGLERQLKEAARLGFRRALVPKSNLPLASKIDALQVSGIEYLVEALESAMPGEKFTQGAPARLPSAAEIDFS